MNRRTHAILQLALWFALGASAIAADHADLYFVHGIPGRAIAGNLDPALPIDVLINGESCLVQGLTFTNTTGPFPLSPGRYDLQISPANTDAPCANPPVLDSQVTLTSGASVSVVAAISAGQPVPLDFAGDLFPLTRGSARFVFIQSADAPTLQVTLTQVRVKHPKSFTVTADRGAQAEAIVPAGTYLVRVFAADSTALLTSEQIGLGDRYSTFTYATGVAENNSVVLVNRVIRTTSQPAQSQAEPSSGGSF